MSPPRLRSLLFPYTTLFRSRRRGSDTDLLRRADASGIDFVAFDFFNFALFRSARDGFHTWNSDIETYRQRTVAVGRSEEHTSELQSRGHLVCRLLLEKKTIS